MHHMWSLAQLRSVQKHGCHHQWHVRTDGHILPEMGGAGKSIHYIEFGVGGGTSATGDTKATTAEEAAFTPFFGE